VSHSLITGAAIPSVDIKVDGSQRVKEGSVDVARLTSRLIYHDLRSHRVFGVHSCLDVHTFNLLGFETNVNTLGFQVLLNPAACMTGYPADKCLVGPLPAWVEGDAQFSAGQTPAFWYFVGCVVAALRRLDKEFERCSNGIEKTYHRSYVGGDSFFYISECQTSDIPRGTVGAQLR
jgi:hypothetical protein